VYLKTIKESEEFTKILQTLNIYFEFNIKIYEINYKSTSKNREKTLVKFKNDNTCINIICNVHILDEGIDIPECDSVYLTHPNNNPINIIQRISRSNRLDINNKDKISKIFLWCKNEIKLEQIINNLSKYVKINYGKEYNNIINNKNKHDDIIIDKKIEYKNNNYIIMSTNISLKDFLKTYTAISGKFIDDYYYFYELCENNIFGIESNKVIKYLGLKDNNFFNEILRNNFILDVDYIIKRYFQKSEKGVKDVYYYLSFDGFEKVCMTSKHKKDNSIINYFITLRKSIEYYRGHFANEINSLTIS
jgi:predicted helicase